MGTPRILFVVTSASQVSGIPKATGSWLEEVVAPYYAFLDARCAVTIASPKGGNAPVDAESLEATNQTPSTRRYEADSDAQALLAHTHKLSDLNIDEYDAVFFPGGHGTMQDFPQDAAVIALVERFYTQDKPVCSVCHGPAALVNAKKPNGEPLVKGHRFTCFTDAEETAVGLDKAVPFMLESRLVEQGGIADTSMPFAAQVVVDGCLITGQNPASAIPSAVAVIYQMRNSQLKRAA